MTDWSFSPIFDSYGLIALAILALSLLLWIRPNFGQASRRRRGVLGGLRLLVVLLLLLAALRPTCVRTTSKTERSTLLILADRSRSMRQPHAAGSQTRWEAQRAALDACTATLADVSRDVEVKAWTYADSLQAIEGGIVPLVDMSPDGNTDIGDSLQMALRSQLGKRLVGVVLLGDGVQTVVSPRVELYDAAREVGRLGYPLFPVVFGPVAAAAQARDVAVESLPDQFTVFVKNELRVKGAIRVRGYVNQAVPIELTLTDAAGQTRIVGTRSVTAPEDNALVDVAFDLTPQETGVFKLSLRAAAQAGELVTQNNELGAYLHVLEGGLKVLYLEGELRHEQLFLSRSLDASPDLDLEFQWIDPRRRDRWPVDLSSLLEKPKFDVLILGDLDSTALGDRGLEAIAKAVDSGRGLAMLGGYHSFGPGGYGEGPLSPVLPIKMDKFERQMFDEPHRVDLHVAGPVKLALSRPHPITQLAAGADNESRWGALPPLDGINKFLELKSGAGTQVLLESTRQEPVLVTSEYGKGRVLTFAGDSTWRWRMRGRGDDHRRFWRQAILWLARREDSQRNDVWLRLAQRRLLRGAKLTWSAGARAPTGEPLPDAQLAADLVGPDGKRTPLPLAKGKEEWNGVVETRGAPGDYRIELRALVQGKVVGEARGEFLVFDQDLELATPGADHDQMARLADLTRDHGGRVVAPEGLPALLAELAEKSRSVQVEVQTSWRLGDTALDAWLVFLAMVALLSAEWYLRKRWGLV